MSTIWYQPSFDLKGDVTFMSVKRKTLIAICFLLLFSLVMASCAKQQPTQEPPAAAGSVDTQEGTTEDPAEDAEEDHTEYVTYRSGYYENGYFETTYDNEVFSLVQQSESEDKSDYLFSLIPIDGELQSYPRIDITNMDVSALTEESIAEQGEDAAKADFGAFCEYLLETYYPRVVIDDSEMTRETTNIEVTLEINSGERYGKAIIDNAPFEMLDMPAMRAQVEMIGDDNSGMLKILFYPIDIDKNVEAFLIEQMSGVKWVKQDG